MLWHKFPLSEPATKLFPGKSGLFCILLHPLISEIIWALKSVWSGYSNNSINEVVSTFRVMFPDSQIAKNMKLRRTKLSYIINHGRRSQEVPPIHCVSFDESLSEVVQECEMVVLIRY